MILINGACPRGVSHCASAAQPKAALPGWIPITLTPARLPPPIACHPTPGRADGAGWGHRP